MTEQETEDWLSVAVGVIGEQSRSVIARAALEAQKTCTHHSQIVPSIMKFCEERDKPSQLGNLVANCPPFVAQPQLPAPKMTQADVDAMSPELVRMGLTCGALIERDGKVVVNPE